jgi:hypothetical protein
VTSTHAPLAALPPALGEDAANGSIACVESAETPASGEEREHEMGAQVAWVNSADSRHAAVKLLAQVGAGGSRRAAAACCWRCGCHRNLGAYNTHAPCGYLLSLSQYQSKPYAANHLPAGIAFIALEHYPLP